MLDHALPRLLVFQRLNREWRPHLSPAERDFLLWFLDNTVCWGRETLRVTVKQMAEGTHWLKTSDIPERTLWRIIGSLKAKGLIAVRALGKVNEFAINLFWKPEATEMLRVPKRLQGQPTQEVAQEPDLFAEEASANLAESACQNGMPYIEEANKQDADYSAASQRGSLPSVPSFGLVRQRTRPVPASADPAPTTPDTPSGSLMGKIKAVMAKTAARREQKAKPLTNATIWRHAWEGSFEGVPAKVLGPRELGMLSTLHKRMQRGSLDWNDFLHWSVANWREIVADKFEWMTRSKPPTFPEVGFLVRFADNFLDAYARRREQEEIKTAPAEVAEYRKLRVAGMGHDDALIEIGKRRAASEGRDEVAKEREYVNRMWRTIEAERKKMERQRLVSPAPETRKVRPEIKHGDNPYEQENPDIVDFSKLDMRWEE